MGNTGKRVAYSTAAVMGAIIVACAVSGGVAVANSPHVPYSIPEEPDREGPLCPIDTEDPDNYEKYGQGVNLDQAAAMVDAWVVENPYEDWPLLSHSDEKDVSAVSKEFDAVLVEAGCTSKYDDSKVDLLPSYAGEVRLRQIAQAHTPPIEQVPTVPSEGGTDIDVNVPRIRSPFYCSWSFRGGFNCGIRG